MTSEYDHTLYYDQCRHCGTTNNFARFRVLHERNMLEIGDGYVDVDDEDIDVNSDWRYYCVACGLETDELEDLLLEIEDDI